MLIHDIPLVRKCVGKVHCALKVKYSGARSLKEWRVLGIDYSDMSVDQTIVGHSRLTAYICLQVNNHQVYVFGVVSYPVTRTIANELLRGESVYNMYASQSGKQMLGRME